MTRNTKLALAVIGVALYPSSTFAHGVSTIYSPHVHGGEAAVELKGGYRFNEENGNHDGFTGEAVVGYGVTSFWETEVGVAYDYEEGEVNDFSALVWENKFQLAPEGALIVDPGLKIEYARSLTGGPDEIIGRLLLAKEIGKFKNLSNISIGREFGEDSEDETEYGFSYGLSYDYTDTFAYGLEWHSDFGNFEGDYNEQSHRVGPAIYGNLAENVPFEAGVLFGVSDHAPEAELKAVVEYEF